MSLPDRAQPNNARAFGGWANAHLVITVIFVATLLFTFEYAPLQDFSEWIYQATVANFLLRGTPSDVVALKSYPVPYALAQGVLSVLLIVFSPFAVSKIFMAIYVFGALLVTRAFILRHHLNCIIGYPFILSAFVFNSCFWNGYIGYQLGFLIFVVYLCLPDDVQSRLFTVMSFSVLTFFSHGIVYVVFGVTSLILSLHARRIGTYLAGVLPSAGLAAWYFGMRTASSVDWHLSLHSVTEVVLYKLYTAMKAGAYHNLLVHRAGDENVLPMLPALGIVANSLFSLFFGALLVIALWRAATGPRANPWFVCGIFLMMSGMLLPPEAAAIANPGERVMYPALILLAIPLFNKARPMTTLDHLMLSSLLLGFFLTAVGAITMHNKYALSQFTSTVATDSDRYTRQNRVLFGHDLTRFEGKIKGAQAAWESGLMPTLPIAFDTALLGSRRGGLERRAISK